MAVLEQKTREGDSGFEKKFEAGSETLLFDFVQQTQYQFPIPSAIRELVTNCRDSVAEKQMFFAINSGRAKVSDFYVEQEGDLYKDSRYDPTYYEEKWLSKSENQIKLIYKVNNNAQRDTFHIIDNGVGLGRQRLEKSFNPLFSSKRLNKTQVGKYGIGSKAGLALQVDYYTLISRYNGCEFHFNVYDYKVDPTVPRYDLESQMENGYYEMQTATEKLTDGTERPRRLYYYKTDKPNGVEVILQAKKGLRREFIDAVKSQLLYLDGIEFELHEGGEVIPQVVKAEIEYEDDIFVLPTASSTYYSKPHLILNGICYGYVNFLQLEEEDKVGNIGIKVDPSSVDVNPNRESVRWTEKTRNAIHSVFKQGELIAEKLIAEALVSTDIIDWCMKSAAAMGGANNNSIVGRFAKIIDLKSIKPKFNPMPKIKFEPDPDRFFTGYDVVVVTPKQKFSKARQMHIPSLERETSYSWQDFNNRPVFYQDELTSFRQEMFMLSLYPQGFIKVIPKGRTFQINEEREKLTKAEEALLDISWEDWNKLDGQKKLEHFNLQSKKWEGDRALMDQLIRDSKFVELYTSVTVPKEFSVYEKEEEEDTADAADKILKDMTDAERRKLENRIVVNALYSYALYSYGYDWCRAKREPKINEILKEKETIIYGFQEDEQNLRIVHELLINESHKISWDENPKVCMIAQTNAKYFKHHMYVDDFFMSFNPETKTISMHNKLVKWQTARKIKAELPKLQFLKNFSLFDPIAAKLWSELVEYVRLNGVDLIKQGDTISELENYADKVTEFQLFVAEHKGNDQAIAAKSKQLFETNEEGSFKDAVGIEFEPYQKLQQLLETAAPVQLMLNTCKNLVESAVIDYKLEQEIKDYLSYKGYISLPEPASAPTLQVAEQAELIEA